MKKLGAPRRTRDQVLSDFWSRVDKTPGLGPNGECWQWTAGTFGKDRYGAFSERSLTDKPKQWSCHRLSFFLKNGPIPSGMVVRHSCDNPICVNPSHLSLGTHRDNALDKMKKGRGSWERTGNSKLTERQVELLRELYDMIPFMKSGRVKKYGRIKALSIIFDIDEHHVINVGKRISYSKVPELRLAQSPVSLA